MSKVNTFEELEVWKNAIILCECVYLITSESEIKKDFALRDQLRRSALSISSNIAEGFERDSNNSFIYFLLISKGSCGELRTQIHLSYKLNLISEDVYTDIREKCIHIGKQLGAFVKYLRQNKLTKPSKLS